MLPRRIRGATIRQWIAAAASRQHGVVSRLQLVASGRLARDEVTSYGGIPVTTPARTLFDLASVLDRHGLEHAFPEAEVLRLLSPVSVPALLERHPGRRGAKALRAVLEDLGDRGADVTRSELEDRFRALVADAGLPRPRLNSVVEAAGRRYEVDAVWPAAGLVAELDGAAVHQTRRAFEADRRRDRALIAAGWRVVRITWRELLDRPHQVEADLVTLLSMPP